MGAPVLIIAGHELPQRSRLDYQQTIERIDGGIEALRMGNGALLATEHFERWRSTISGSGWIPAPLLSLPRGVPFTVHCVQPIALRIDEPLPAGWSERVDWPAKTLTLERGVQVRMVYPIFTMVTMTGARLVLPGRTPQWELAMEEA